jgi:hypothetical protein
MGYLKIEDDHYVEVKALPKKRELIETLIDKNNLEAPIMGTIRKLDNGKSEILSADKKTYLFDVTMITGVLHIGDKVTFKTAYTIGNLHCARNITRINL